MKYILVLVFYGIAYLTFENVFNFLTIDLFDKKKTWREKLRLKASVSSSFWMFPCGAIIGLLLHLFVMISLNMSNIFIFILVGLFGSVIITGIELASGLLLNIKMKLNLWDYSKSVLNFKGQIDLFHSLGWVGITYLFYFVDKLFK
jgi:uncharacterized membrane protein